MPSDHWNHHAQQWQHVAPPLRPSAEDIELMTVRVAALDSVTTSVLLGVTPEIAGMHWPRGTRLLAVDRCMGMIQGVWPCGGVPDRHAVCGDWLALPITEGSADLIVGDGCFTLLPYPDGLALAYASAARALRPGGAFMMRYFCRPESAEPLDAVFADLEAGRVGNFHVLKWRMAMALHGDASSGVSVGAVWEALNAAVSDRDAFAKDLGWPRAAIDTIDVYRGVDTRYYFPTLDEIREVTSQHFEELSVDTPSYELGERCPIVCYRRRA